MFVRQAGGRHPQRAAGPKLWRTPTGHDRRAWAAGRGPRSTSKMIRACREGDDAHAQAAHDAALGAVLQAPRDVGWARVALSRRVPARRAALRAWARPRARIPGTSPGRAGQVAPARVGALDGTPIAGPRSHPRPLPHSARDTGVSASPGGLSPYTRLSVAWRALATDDEHERRVRLLLSKGAVLAHRLDRPLAPEMDEYEPAAGTRRGAKACCSFDKRA